MIIYYSRLTVFVTLQWHSYEDSDIHNPGSRDWLGHVVLFQCITHCLCLSCLLSSFTVWCLFSCSSLFLPPCLLTVSHSFLLRLHHLLSLIFHTRAAPQILLSTSPLTFLSSSHVCLSSSPRAAISSPSAIPPPHFNALCVLHIIIPPFLSIIPPVPLSALSEAMSADTPQPHSSLEVCGDLQSFSATLLCYVSTVCVSAHMHPLPPSIPPSAVVFLLFVTVKHTLLTCCYFWRRG